MKEAITTKEPAAKPKEPPKQPPAKPKEPPRPAAAAPSATAAKAPPPLPEKPKARHDSGGKL